MKEINLKLVVRIYLQKNIQFPKLKHELSLRPHSSGKGRFWFQVPMETKIYVYKKRKNKVGIGSNKSSRLFA